MQLKKEGNDAPVIIYPPTIPLPEDKEEIIALWQSVFHDSEDYIDLFFNQVYNPDNTLVIKTPPIPNAPPHNQLSIINYQLSIVNYQLPPPPPSSQIVAALQMVPYQIKCGNQILPAAYVCGVCTHPSQRKKGIMKILMTEAMAEMRRRGYVVSIVIPAEPWLFDFYKKFGYTLPLNRYILQSATSTSATSASARADLQSSIFAECTSAHFYYFDRKQRERRCTVLHNAHDYASILQDLRAEGGNAYILFKNDTPTGMAFVSKIEDNTLIIKEILYETTTDITLLATHISRQYGSAPLSMRIPACALNDDWAMNPEIHPYGLACLLDPHQSLFLSDLHVTLMLD